MVEEFSNLKCNGSTMSSIVLIELISQKTFTMKTGLDQIQINYITNECACSNSVF